MPREANQRPVSVRPVVCAVGFRILSAVAVLTAAGCTDLGVWDIFDILTVCGGAPSEVTERGNRDRVVDYLELHASRGSGVVRSGAVEVRIRRRRH